MESPELYLLDVNNTWHDFGRMLISGFMKNGVILRTGPFVPPVSFPSGFCAITESVRDELVPSGLRGLRFADAKVGKVVEVNWETWDRSQPLDFNLLPLDERMGGVEDLIFVPKHRPDLAARMPKLFYLQGMAVERYWVENESGEEVVSWSHSGFDQADVYSIGDCWPGLTYVNSRGKEWFEERYSEWVTFESVPVGD
jgi:hypothetical protein